MLTIGVQTKGILDEYVSGNNIDLGFAKIKRAGFDCIDFNIDVFLKNTDVYGGKINKFFDKSEDELKEFFMPYKNAMEKYGITASQMHAPYPVKIIGKVEQNKYMMEQVIPKSLFIASFLSIPYVVIHPIKMQYTKGKEVEKQENYNYFKSLIPLAKRYGVNVCMENLYEDIGGRIVEGPCVNPDEVLWYMEHLNDEAGEEIFGMCLDTGHLNLVHRDTYDYITKIGRYLRILHMHDNDAKGDLHQLPYSFCYSNQEDGNLGTGIHWDRLLQALKEINYRGTLSFETFPCMNSFPISNDENVLKLIVQTGKYFASKIEE